MNTKFVFIENVTKQHLSKSQIQSILRCNSINSSACPTIRNHSKSTTVSLANADTGTDGNYMCHLDMKYVTSLKPDTSRSVSLPDGRLIVSTHSGVLDLPSLPLSARKCWVFEELIGSLLCPGDWVDSGANVMYTKSEVIVKDDNDATLLVGQRVPDTKLWMINLDKATQPQPAHITAANQSLHGHINAATYIHRSKAQLMAWISGYLGFPTDSSILAGLRNGSLIVPGLTSEVFAAFPPNDPNSSLGHLDQTRSGLRSTALQSPLNETSADVYPSKSLTGAASKARTITSKLMPSRQLHALFSDLPGRFPVASTCGNEYVLVFFYEEGNYIHLQALPNRSGEQQAKAHAAGLAFFAKHGVTSHDYAMMDG